MHLSYWRETPRERDCSLKLSVPAHIKPVGVRVRLRAAAGAAVWRCVVDAVDVLAVACRPRCASPRTEMPLTMDCCSSSSCWWIVESLSSPPAPAEGGPWPCGRAIAPEIGPDAFPPARPRSVGAEAVPAGPGPPALAAAPSGWWLEGRGWWLAPLAWPRGGSLAWPRHAAEERRASRSRASRSRAWFGFGFGLGLGLGFGFGFGFGFG